MADAPMDVTDAGSETAKPVAPRFDAGVTDARREPDAGKETAEDASPPVPDTEEDDAGSPRLPPSEPEVRLFVDPASGSDNATGTDAEHPLRSLKKALLRAKRGYTLYLQPGTYVRGPLEDWSILVPERITIQAVIDGTAVLVGDPEDTALTLAGSATVSGLVFKGFKNAVVASSGNVTLRSVTVDTGGGLLFTGTAKATVTNSTLTHLNRAGVSTSDRATVVVRSSSIQGTGRTGNCHPSGAEALGNSRLTLESVTVSDLSGYGLTTSGSAFVSVTDSTFLRNGQGTCGRSQIDASGPTSLRVYRTSLLDGAQRGVTARAKTTVELNAVTIGKHESDGIEVVDSNVTVANSHISPGGTAITLRDGQLITENTSITSNKVSIDAEGGYVELRRTDLLDCENGFLARSSRESLIDFGTESAPGGNTFSCKYAGVALYGDYVRGQTFGVAGNHWVPSEQGADAEGVYPAQVLRGPVNGRNVYVRSNTVSLQF